MEAILRDVVGLYLEPSCGWGGGQPSTRNPRSRCRIGSSRFSRCAQGISEQHTHDYIRPGTASLFAALGVATGRVTADNCYPPHTNVEFLAFSSWFSKAHPRLRLRVICDNYATPASQPGWTKPESHPAFHADQLLVAGHG